METKAKAVSVGCLDEALKLLQGTVPITQSRITLTIGHHKFAFKRHVNPDGSAGGWVENSTVVGEHHGNKSYIDPTAVLFGGSEANGCHVGEKTVLFAGVKLDGVVLGPNQNISIEPFDKSWVGSKLAPGEIFIDANGPVAFKPGDRMLCGGCCVLDVPDYSNKNFQWFLREWKDFIKDAPKDTNDIDRAYNLVNFVNHHMKYDMMWRDQHVKNDPEHMLSEALKDHRGVCKEMAAVLCMLLDHEGIKWGMTGGNYHHPNGEIEPHAWVRVYIGKKDMIADPTLCEFVPYEKGAWGKGGPYEAYGTVLVKNISNLESYGGLPKASSLRRG